MPRYYIIHCQFTFSRDSTEKIATFPARVFTGLVFTGSITRGWPQLLIKVAKNISLCCMSLYIKWSITLWCHEVFSYYIFWTINITPTGISLTCGQAATYLPTFSSPHPLIFDYSFTDYKACYGAYDGTEYPDVAQIQLINLFRCNIPINPG